jgi:glycosyltransferase involved in cell wall biosynthesis
VPTWNRASLLGQTIRSILASDHPVAELLIVDDGSSDGTAAVAAGFGMPVRLLQIPNSGTAAARVAGIKAAHHDWLAFCDDDDLWQSDHLSRLIALASRHAVPFAFSNFRHMRAGVPVPRSHFSCDPSRFWGEPGRRVGEEFFVADEPLFPHVLAYQAIFPSCTLVNRDFYECVGGINALFTRNPSEDLEFTLRCVRHAPTGIDTRATVHIRRHGGNYSADWINGLIGSIEILEFAAAHHELPEAWRSAIDYQRSYRSIEGIDHAFPQHRFGDVAWFAHRIPGIDRSWKTRLKIAIAALPRPVGGIVADLLTRGVPWR